MNSVIERRLAQLLQTGADSLLQARKIGLERESLRVSSDGQIAQTPHPSGLGSALTHPHITTDYSEALLEFVTPPFADFSETLSFLDTAQRYVASQLDDEFLWASSMPCAIGGEKRIPIAQYGTSNAGLMKTAYRRGLGHRYGRTMQVISGIHYNYSYPPAFWQRYQSLLGERGDTQAFISSQYMGMIRNLHRHAWLTPYLFGASPAICESFLGDRSPGPLKRLQQHSYYGPYATSLRMGDIGYQNSKEGKAGIRVNYNSLANYIASLRYAIHTPCAQYATIPLQRDGQWQQLNANILQIENEHYSSVRPKQIPHGEEQPTTALEQRGVAYIELRSLDVDVFQPLGIDREQMQFLESFLLLSLLTPSPPLLDDEQQETKHNLNLVAHSGRDPRLQLRRNGRPILLRDWIQELFEQFDMSCELLDAGRAEPLYCKALGRQRNKIENPDETPSARVLAEMMARGEEFFEFSLRHSLAHQEWFRQRPLDAPQQAEFAAAARASLQRQAQLEAAASPSFAQFLQTYFEQR